eukprot:c25791_g1_i1 orf=659-2437(-)
MRRRYGHLVGLYTAFSVCGVAWRINNVLRRAAMDGVLIGGQTIGHREAVGLLRYISRSPLSMALLSNLVINCFILMALFVKVLFFGELSLVETQKVVERLINYVLFKGLFLAWVVQPEILQIALWIGWFAILGFLKMFQGSARDRLERLNASPTATMLSHVRVFAVLVLVLLSDLFWIHLCIFIFKDAGISTFLLLLFEPLIIALDTIQAVVVHGMQLLDTWQQRTMDLSSQYTGLQPSERSAAGAAWEWRGTMVRNCSFAMDLVAMLLALGHCLHVWCLRGLGFQVVDGILFLNLRALLSAILRRIKGFMRLKTAMNTLQGALPDATEEELLTYDDDCAICKEPMARAKRLPCAHLFHLACLRSWLDQGLADTYSCPTCRRPLFMGSVGASRAEVWNPVAEGNGILQALNEGDRRRNDRHLFGNIHRPNSETLLPRPFSIYEQNVPVNRPWSAFPAGSMEGEAPSTIPASGGLGRMHIIMRHLASSGQSYSRNQSGEGSWRWWPFADHGIADDSGSAALTARHGVDTNDFRFPNHAIHFRSRDAPGLDIRAPQMDAMVSLVREVLPHIPDEIVIQDLRRTNSVTTTVNNLL